ncbi:MAG: DUF5996 family protein [Myxococcota bacterium]|nr:DUF5996 family protein [Myxococcota bacterium]
MRSSDSTLEAWPELTSEGWLESSRALHLFTQVVGKTRLSLAPLINHWWQVPLYVTARGLGTSPIPYEGLAFEVEFDLLDAQLHIRTSEGDDDRFPLDAPTVAEFYDRFFQGLHRLGVDVSITPLAVEIPETILLDRDRTVRRFDPVWGRSFFRALTQMHRVLEEFRADFTGKASPVHFFWGSFDLATSRYSGRRAPVHPGGAPHCGDFVMEEAYSHEVSSAGFWIGNAQVPRPLFYSYAYPMPADFPTTRVLPHEASFDAALGEFVLPYDTVRSASSPDFQLRQFLHSTYVAAAELGSWPRQELERRSFATRARQEDHPGVPL